MMLETKRAMMNVLQQLGPVRVVDRDGDTVEVEVPNPAAAPVAPAE